MEPHGPVCPHPGCDALNRAGASFCARCGRPLVVGAQRRKSDDFPIAIGWFIAALITSIFMFPCLFSNLRHPGQYVFFAIPLFFWWQAFNKPPRVPR